jgi:hypothetical protein
LSFETPQCGEIHRRASEPAATGLLRPIPTQLPVRCLYKGIENPEERLDIDTERVVTREAWTAAVIETMNEFIDEVAVINPAVKSTSNFELLR